VANSVTGLTKVQIDGIHRLSLIHEVGHLVIAADEVGQGGPAFHEPMLTGTDPLVVFHMPVESTQGEFPHNLPQH